MVVTPQPYDAASAVRHWRAFFEEALEGLLLSTGGVVLEANQRSAEVCGLAAEELRGRQVAELFVPEERSRESAALVAPADARETHEARLRRPDGTLVWLEVRHQPTEWEGRAVVLSTLRDITARKQAEQALRIERQLAVDLGTTSDLGQALRQVLEAALAVDEVACGGLYVVEERTGAVALACHRGLSPEFVATASRYGAESANARLVMLGQPVYAPYAEILPDSQDAVRRAEGLGAVGIVPIQHDGQTLAALILASRESRPIPAPARSTLESIAGLAGGFLARVRAEARVHQQRENLQGVFDSIHDLLFILDREGRILHVNREALERLGRGPGELIGSSVLEVHPLQRRAEAQERIAAMLAGDATLCLVPVVTSDGREIPVETRVTHCRWDGQEVLIGITRDVTEARRAEAALRASVAHERALLDALPDMVFRLDGQGVFLEYHGPQDQPAVPPHLIAGMRLEDAPFPPALRQQIGRAVRACLATGALQQLEYEIEAPLGDLSYEARISQSGPDEVVAVVRDVTTRKRTEDILRREAAFREAVVERAAEGLCVCHATEVEPFVRFTVWNGRMCEITGYTLEEINRLGWHQAVYPDAALRARVVARMEQMRAGQDLMGEEWEITRRDGQRRTLAISTSRVAGSDERPHVLALMYDITERKRIEDALRESAQAQAVLLGEVNHRVKNNLSAVVGLLHREYDRARLGGLEPALPILEDLVARVRTLLTVHGLLSQAGWRPLPVAEICEQVIRATVEAGSLRERVGWRISPSALVVESDQAHQLALVVNELATNSVKHALRPRQRLELSLSITLLPSESTLTYRDDGPGFPEGVLAGQPSSSSGLDLVRGIVTHSLRGRVTFGNDRGAVVVVTFPASSAAQDPR